MATEAVAGGGRVVARGRRRQGTAEHEIFALGDFPLQKGGVDLPDAKLGFTPGDAIDDPDFRAGTYHTDTLAERAAG